MGVRVRETYQYWAIKVRLAIQCMSPGNERLHSRPHSWSEDVESQGKGLGKLRGELQSGEWRWVRTERWGEDEYAIFERKTPPPACG